MNRVSFHHVAETFSPWANLKQLFESIQLHLPQWHMHPRNLNLGIFSVTTVLEHGKNIEKISHFAYFCKARSKISKCFSA